MSAQTRLFAWQLLAGARDRGLHHVRQRWQLGLEVLARAVGFLLVALEQIAPARQVCQQQQDVAHLQRGQRLGRRRSGRTRRPRGRSCRTPSHVTSSAAVPRRSRIARGRRSGRATWSSGCDPPAPAPRRVARAGVSASSTRRIAWLDELQQGLAAAVAVQALVDVGQRQVGLDVVALPPCAASPSWRARRQSPSASTARAPRGAGRPTRNAGRAGLRRSRAAKPCPATLGALDLLDEVQRHRGHTRQDRPRAASASSGRSGCRSRGAAQAWPRAPRPARRARRPGLLTGYLR